MTPLANVVAKSDARQTDVGQTEIVLRPSVNDNGMLCWVATFQLAQLQQHVGFRHPGVPFFPITARELVDYPRRVSVAEGLEGDASFLMTYSDAVRQGRRFEAVIRHDWAENDEEY